VRCLGSKSRETQLVEGTPKTKDHKPDAMKKLARANAAKEIAEFEPLKVHTQKNTGGTPPSGVTVSAAVPENPASLSDSKIEGKSQQIN